MDIDGDLERAVMSLIKASEERGDPPLVQATEARRLVLSRGMELPSLELGFVIVSNLCFDNNSPPLWKFLDQVMASRVVSPLHVLALLTARVIPSRRAEPEAYRIYMELLSRYLFANGSMESPGCKEKITELLDNSLHLAKTFGIRNLDFGHVVVFSVLSVILSLIDATLEDWGLPFISIDKMGSKNAHKGLQVMDLYAKENASDKRHDHRVQLRRANSFMALEVVEKVTDNAKAKVFLRLIHFNMPEEFNGLLQRLHFIEGQKSTIQNLKSVNTILEKLFKNVNDVINGAYPLSQRQLLGSLLDAGISSPTSCYNSGTGRAGCWIPFDIFMENSMDGKNLHAIAAIEILTELTKALQVINQASWQETFQALWVSALRLIQRDRDPWEGPIPRLDTRLCMVLSVVPLALVPILVEDRETPSRKTYEHGMEGEKNSSRRQGLVFALQALGQFSGLLSPPAPAVIAANNAASKAATFISNFKSGSGSLSVISHNDSSVKAVGNMLHLIVEACIARKLIDTSAYCWRGYVIPSQPSTDAMLVQESSWSMFMKGSPLTSSLKNALMATPAPGVAELEKLYHIALHGSQEERTAAAKILCSASLTCGWNVQEHVVHILVKLLSPPLPASFAEPDNKTHLINHMPMLGSILFEVARVEIVHIFSLYGMVPELAAVLMPLCEAFGSMTPQSNQRSSPADETSIYSVFSCAFLLLLRLWKFYKPPQEHCLAGHGTTIKVELSLDYLLLMRNSRIALNSTSRDRGIDPLYAPSDQPVYIESFPKLRAWYFQNKACIASTLSGLCNKNPVHQVANTILSMICRKMAKVGAVSGNPSNSTGSINGSPVSSTEDTFQKPILPAWDVLEAVPFVLEAVLTACSHGRLSSRDLTTGLRDLVEFLPASLATIVSYFLAEITRGVWKPVSMNGTDWPSPAANLLLVESEIKELLRSAGVQLPCSYASGTASMLPLPMAALVSLTITFKLEKNLDYIHAVIGQALENCSTSCSWPSVPIIGALWTQKVKRWHNYVIFCGTLAPFSLNKDAVAQLIRSCFSSFFGHHGSSPQLTSQRGVSGLLGDSIFDKSSSLSIAPGFLFLRTYRSFHDTKFVSNTILDLVIEWAHNLAPKFNSGSPARLRSGQTSVASAAAAAREVAMLGVSLMCIAGGGQMVQVLYEETLPEALMSVRNGRVAETTGPASVLEGYAVAYLLVLAGSCAWGVGKTSPAFASVFTSRRARAISVHMEFMAGVLEGDVDVVCGPSTCKAYASCFVGLLLMFAPEWVPEVRKGTLRKLARALRSWGENELALKLLERGGSEAVNTVVESLL